MKVRCVKFKKDDGTIMWDNGWLEDAKEYIVLGITICDNSTNLYLETSEERLAAYFNIEEFEVLSNYIPSNWTITFKSDYEHIALYPKKWIEEPKGFWEGYTDGELDMVKLYEQERDLIYSEEP